HKPLIGYIKQMPDGNGLYLEEVRTGRHDLAAESLRKYPATMDAATVVKTATASDPNAQSDGGNGVSVVDFDVRDNVHEPKGVPATDSARTGAAVPGGETRSAQAADSAMLPRPAD